jgi:2-methylcitrate dehydratase PrpD
MSTFPGASALSVSQRLSNALVAIDPDRLPAAVLERASQLLLDCVGLCVAARRMDYVQALVASCADAPGRCTAIGHPGRLDPYSAALINGTAIHGEDFDDTFEGGIVHSGAVVVPAVLAACEQHGRDGRAMRAGMVAGLETMCRLSLVAPKRIHTAGFHPTSVLGHIAATAGAGVALGLDARQLASAFGIASSFAGGVIEYLADGSWTKRMHPGWAAQAGLRAAAMARHGYFGPQTAFEGVHGLFNGFAHSRDLAFTELVDGWDDRWHCADIAFKPYACGTMAQPYIDCALRLAARGVRHEDVVDIDCETAEGYVHRLWDPLPLKQRPPNAYAAKFSLPYIIATAWVKRDAGLGAFTDDAVHDAAVLALAAKVRYTVDPANPYPKVITGHLGVRLRDGSRIDERQPYLRGGVNAPLTQADLEAKFSLNCAFGGLDAAASAGLRGFAAGAFAAGGAPAVPAFA